MFSRSLCNFSFFKAVVHVNLSEMKFKEGLKGKKFWNTTVERLAKGTPGWWATVWRTSTNF